MKFKVIFYLINYTSIKMENYNDTEIIERINIVKAEVENLKNTIDDIYEELDELIDFITTDSITSNER